MCVWLNDLSLDSNSIQAMAAMVMVFFAAMQWYIQKEQRKQDLFRLKYDVYRKLLEINQILKSMKGHHDGGLSLSCYPKDEKEKLKKYCYEAKYQTDLLFTDEVACYTKHLIQHAEQAVDRIGSVVPENSFQSNYEIFDNKFKNIDIVKNDIKI